MLKRLIALFCSLRLVPHVLVYYSASSARKSVLDYERDRWLEKNRFPRRGLSGFLFLLNMFPEYRTLFYHRTGANWLSLFARGQVNLYIHTPSSQIGKGLVLWHGFSSILNAQEIGEDCEIWHGVTLGKKTTDDVLDKPVIGKGVRLCTGCIVIGNVKVGDFSTVAAGSVVVRDVPPGAMMAGEAACLKRGA